MDSSSEDEYNYAKLKAKDVVGYRWEELFKDHIQSDKNLTDQDLTSEYDDETFHKLFERRKVEVAEKIWGDHAFSKTTSTHHQPAVIQFERD